MDDSKNVDWDAVFKAFLDSDRTPPSMPLKVVAGTMVGVLFYAHAHAHFDRPSPPFPPDEHIEQATSTASLNAVYSIQPIMFNASAEER